MNRYIRFSHQSEIHYGLLSGTDVTLLNGSSPENFSSTGKVLPIRAVTLLPPCLPSKIIGMGANYSDKVLEEGTSFPKEPLFCIMPPTAMIGDGEPILKKPFVTRLACEAELGVVIGKTCVNIDESDADDYIWGYLAANDVTAQDLQDMDVQWTRAKSFDTFLPISSVIVNGIDPESLWIRSYINRQLGQSGNTDKMIFGVNYLVSFLSQIMTLLPGDIIITGTPSGYGCSVSPGDEVMIEIEHLGSVTNTVEEWRP